MFMTVIDTTALGDIWMEVRDRKLLLKLMAIQGVSQRELARAAGWKVHSYMNRLVRGEAKNLETDPALRIAHYLGVGVDDIFLTKSDKESVYATKHAAQRKRVVSSKARTSK